LGNPPIGTAEFRRDKYPFDRPAAAAEKVPTAPANPVPADAAEMRQFLGAADRRRFG